MEKYIGLICLGGEWHQTAYKRRLWWCLHTVVMYMQIEHLVNFHTDCCVKFLLTGLCWAVAVKRTLLGAHPSFQIWKDHPAQEVGGSCPGSVTGMRVILRVGAESVFVSVEEVFSILANLQNFSIPRPLWFCFPEGIWRRGRKTPFCTSC